MLDKKNLVQLAKTVAKADPSAPVSYSFNGENFSYEALNETLRRGFAPRGAVCEVASRLCGEVSRHGA